VGLQLQLLLLLLLLSFDLWTCLPACLLTDPEGSECSGRAHQAASTAATAAAAPANDVQAI
jgi:hypothetical protein